MTIKTEDANTLYTVAEVQSILKCGRTKAYELLSREIPTVKIGRGLRVTKRDLDAFIAENRNN